jgi:uncharacterized membrane protein affecting hemolysin expression
LHRPRTVVADLAAEIALQVTDIVFGKILSPGNIISATDDAEKIGRKLAMQNGMCVHSLLRQSEKNQNSVNVFKDFRFVTA